MPRACVPEAKIERHFQKKTFPLPTFYAPRFLAATVPFIKAPPKEIKLVSQSFLEQRSHGPCFNFTNLLQSLLGFVSTTPSSNVDSVNHTEATFGRT
jgi:hypothetical protein|mmetsp:Transcript_35899/g.73136  ORF Transcript_35899/g.73136 Transcript_35899/m.73136 type:complete len:97 (+) Transcript_35899:180-470(+)